MTIGKIDFPISIPGSNQSQYGNFHSGIKFGKHLVDKNRKAGMEKPAATKIKQ